MKSQTDELELVLHKEHGIIKIILSIIFCFAKLFTGSKFVVDGAIKLASLLLFIMMFTGRKFYPN
jgi:hypothetical protein